MKIILSVTVFFLVKTSLAQKVEIINSEKSNIIVGNGNNITNKTVNIFNQIQKVTQTSTDRFDLYLGFRLSDLRFDSTQPKYLNAKYDSLNKICLTSVNDNKFYLKNKKVLQGLIDRTLTLQQNSFRQTFVLKTKDEYAALAEAKTKDINASYWTYEAEKTTPSQGIRMMTESLKNASDQNIRQLIKEKIEKNFNKSNNHQYLEVFKAPIEAPFSIFYNGTRWILAGDLKENTCRLWNIQESELLELLKSEKKIGTAIFSPDGKWLITISREHQNRVWSLSDGKSMDFLDNEPNIRNVYFSPKSGWLVIDNGRTHKLLSLTTGQEANFLKNEKNIHKISFSSNEQWLITSDFWENKIWSLPEGKLQNLLKNDNNM